MGLFFEDTKPPEPQPPVIHQVVKQDWLAVFVAGVFAIASFIVIALVKAVAFFAKPIFGYLFTFEGRTRQQIVTQMIIATILIAGPFLALYVMSPTVRDAISLSNSHTINHTNGNRILFPDRHYFTVGGARIGYPFEGKTLITYAGYTEGTTQKMSPGTCQMVPRGMKIRLSSINQPTNAEGFKDEVKYAAMQRVVTLTGFDYFLEWVKRPKLWLSKREIDETVIEVEKEFPWRRFIDDWSIIEFNDGLYRSFEVKALATEHAIICF